MSSQRHGANLKLNVSMAGQDQLHHKVILTMKDVYSLQKEFTRYLNTEDIVPKMIVKGLLSESEVYSVRNPYLPPNQRIFELFQFVANKGPDAPAKILECLTEKPLIPGHMYLASRLTGSSSEEASYKSSPHYESIINPAVTKKIDTLKYLFADLLMEAHRYIVSSGVHLEEFRIFLSFMSASSSNSSSLFFRDHLPSLSTASSIDQMFAIVNENRYWNHFNYHLLEAVVRKFCNKTIQKKLEDYTEQVISFENTVTLSEYSLNVPQSLSIPDRPDFTQFKTTLTPEYKDWNKYKLLEARTLQMKMCDKLNMPQHALLFQTAEVGSIVMVWSVPSSVVDSIHLLALTIPSELLKIKIATVQINNTTLHMDRESADAYENIPTHALPERLQATHLCEEVPPEPVLNYLDSLETSVTEFMVKLKGHKDLLVRKQQLETSSSTLLTQQSAPQRSHSAQSVYPPMTTPIDSPHPHDYDHKHRGKLGIVRKGFVVHGHIRHLSKEDSEEEYADYWINKDSGYSERGEWTGSNT